MLVPDEPGDFEEVNKKRIKAIEKCFNSSAPLLVEGRKLMAKGIHQKVCRKKNKPRIFVLFDDILVYGDYISDKSYKKQRILPLETMSIADVADTEDQKYAWQIKHAVKSFTVISDSDLEKINWMNALEQLIAKRQEQLMNEGKLKKVEESPVWTPDKLVTKCQHCTKNFTSVTRRHHCRKCGGVFCKACSKYTLILPEQSSKPLRVCINCKMADEESSTKYIEPTFTNTNEKIEDKEEQQSESDHDSSFDSDGDFLQQPMAVAYKSNESAVDIAFGSVNHDQPVAALTEPNQVTMTETAAETATAAEEVPMETNLLE